VFPDAAYTRRVRGAVERRRPVVDGRTALLPRHRPRDRLVPYVTEARTHHATLEIGADGPETGRVQSGGIAGHIGETGGDKVAEAGERRQVGHAVESRTGARPVAPAGWRRGRTAARCTNAFLCWPRNPLEFNSSPGRESGPKRQADVAQLVERNLAKVEVASSSLVVRSKEQGDLPEPLTPGGVAERRGNGLQSRLHGFKSRLHLQGRLAQRESASLTRKRSLVQSQYRPLDLRQIIEGLTRAISSAGERFPDTEEVTGSIPVSRTRYHRDPRITSRGRLAQRESASLTRKRSLVQSQYRPHLEAPGRLCGRGLRRAGVQLENSM
jgi:hypothetical protein